jgi:putative metalloenzyme radical SAM/SPASM domain maturase
MPAPLILPLTAPFVAPAYRDYPSKLFLEPTTCCNLSCPMCVKQATGSVIADGYFPSALLTALETAFPHLEAFIISGIGEPLLAKDLAGLIRRARTLMPATAWIGLQTNGSLLTVTTAVDLISSGLKQVCISLDAATPDKFRNLRVGEEIDAVDLAFTALRQAKDFCQRPEVLIGVEFVVRQSNLTELPEVVRWAAQRGASYAVVSHLLPFDENHVAEVSFGNCTDQAIELFRKWQEQGKKLGVDLRSYYEDRLFRKYVRLPEMKFNRDPEELPIFQLVEGLKAEAQQYGITLDIRKLFMMDFARLTMVTEIFAKAQTVAHDLGIDLHLPELTLREQRRCPFIEEGSAFVSWQGDVSPCHFLWHRYRNQASGWDQLVHQKIFGNLAERDLVDIWNTPEFREFRREALTYDYSSCSSCSLEPCNYILAEEFEQDCHIRNVPCGSCLWNRGVFQCLR